MVSALASSSLGVPRWEVSDVLRLLVRDWDLLRWGWGDAGFLASSPCWEALRPCTGGRGCEVRGALDLGAWFGELPPDARESWGDPGDLCCGDPD